MTKSLADELIDAIPSDVPGMFNPWKERCWHDTASNTLEARRERLARHLDCDARLICIGEAPGYQGCRTSAVEINRVCAIQKFGKHHLGCPAQVTIVMHHLSR